MLNLREVAHRIDVVPNANFAVVTTNSNVDPSLLLVDELWQGDRIKVDGEIVAAIIGSTGLLVSGSRNREGIGRLRSLARLGLEAGQAESPLLVYRRGRFEPFSE